MSRTFTLYVVKPSELTAQRSMTRVADEVRRLIGGTETRVQENEKMSFLTLTCDCHSTEEVKEKLAACTAVHRVMIEDFAFPAPTLLDGTPPEW